MNIANSCDANIDRAALCNSYIYNDCVQMYVNILYATAVLQFYVGLYLV